MLEKIKTPKDVKKISLNNLPKLATEMRAALLNRVSKIGGHVGPNFGSVEAIIALHYVFNCPIDKIIYDVSHQCYPHKLLTGRAYGFLNDKDFYKISGYTDPSESEYDMFSVGHTSTSISLAIGVAKARDLQKQKYNVIAFIGDGSLSGGEALEGLNACNELHSNFIIVLNDNDMCISENHGGLYNHLAELRETKGKSRNNIFKAFGYDYLYVDKGNDIKDLIAAFEKAKKATRPIVVHIKTTKGKGLKFAEENKETSHFKMPFNPKTGQLLNTLTNVYPPIITEYLLNKAKQDPKVLVVSAATPGSFGLFENQRKQLGNQYIDVGIAEETAAAVCSGCAKNGGKPVWPVPASFINRTYDQISQDICLNKSPVAVIVNTNGIYGFKDKTHLGIFDIPFLSSIPNLSYIAPTTKQEFLKAVDYAIEQNEKPVFIKTPGYVIEGQKCTKDFSKIKYEVNQKGKKVAFIGLGIFYPLAEQAAKLYKQKTGITPTLINPYFVTDLDVKTLNSLKKDHSIVVTIEDGILQGGFGSNIARYFGSSNIKVFNYGYKKEFIDRFNIEVVLKENHITPQQIVKDILE